MMLTASSFAQFIWCFIFSSTVIKNYKDRIVYVLDSRHFVIIIYCIYKCFWLFILVQRDKIIIYVGANRQNHKDSTFFGTKIVLVICSTLYSKYYTKWKTKSMLKYLFLYFVAVVTCSRYHRAGRLRRWISSTCFHFLSVIIMAVVFVIPFNNKNIYSIDYTYITITTSRWGHQFFEASHNSDFRKVQRL